MFQIHGSALRDERGACSQRFHFHSGAFLFFTQSGHRKRYQIHVASPRPQELMLAVIALLDCRLSLTVVHVDTSLAFYLATPIGRLSFTFTSERSQPTTRCRACWFPPSVYSASDTGARDSLPTCRARKPRSKGPGASKLYVLRLTLQLAHRNNISLQTLASELCPSIGTFQSMKSILEHLSIEFIVLPYLLSKTASIQLVIWVLSQSTARVQRSRGSDLGCRMSMERLTAVAMVDVSAGVLLILSSGRSSRRSPPSPTGSKVRSQKVLAPSDTSEERKLRQHGRRLSAPLTPKLEPRTLTRRPIEFIPHVSHIASFDCDRR